MSIDGPLSSWTSLSENNLILQPDELINVSVTIKVPNRAQSGNYTSIFKVAFYKTLF